NKRELEAVLIAEGLEAFTQALEWGGQGLASIARAYRRFALSNPQLYRLITERPLPRDLLPDGLEARAAAPIVATAGDPDLARAAWAFAHGMVQLELAVGAPTAAASGNLDNSFGFGGGLLLSVGDGGQSAGNGIALTPTGGLSVAGEAIDGSESKFTLLDLDANASPASLSTTLTPI